VKKYHEKPILRALTSLFFDKSNRPKKTPFYEGIILRRLEGEYTESEIIYALKKLQDELIPAKKRITSRERVISRLGKVIFYYPFILETNQTQKVRIIKKIEKTCAIIKRYSNYKVTTALGLHLHHLVKYELRALQFEIVGENTNEFDGKKWHGHHTLDIIARHKKSSIAIGVEIKNSLDLIPSDELKIKIKMCQSLKIIPVFACRWLGPFRDIITSSSGYPWEFKYQLYPLCYADLAKMLKKKFDLPVIVASEIPAEAVKNFENWLNLRYNI
jgi:hypothetical protein